MIFRKQFSLGNSIILLAFMLPCSLASQSYQSWAQKLGFPKDRKVVILHADDIGMCPEANESVKPMLLQDHIQSAAVMMPCEDAGSIIQWAISHPEEDIGLHLTLTSEWKTHRWSGLVGAEQSPGLHDEDGMLWHSVPQVVQHATAAEVEAEVRAQIEKSIEMGHRPDHIDTHMGTLYGSTAFTEAYLRVAAEYDIPAMVIDMSNPQVVLGFKRQGYPIDDTMINLVKEYPLPKLDFFASVPTAPTYEEKVEKFKILIHSLNPGLTEIIFHPSLLTEGLKEITNSWQQRAWEAGMFSDPAVIAFLEEEQVIFTNWQEIMERFRNNQR
ncbi:MAG: polysaccharide deacetylase family protein [Saprospiraceae bacterium]|nr:polysaccharide deacetylase family protein [Saprospiraceae bacterium]